MKKEICTILSHNPNSSDNQQAVYITENIAKRLNLKKNSMYILTCGIQRIPVQLRTMPKAKVSGCVLWLTEEILKDILIPDGISIEITFSDEIIKIGPIIAVLTENRFLKDYIHGTDVIEEYNLYAHAAQKFHALLYIFTLKDINFEKKYINGFIPKEENNKWIWQRQVLPMPDAICCRMAYGVTSPAYKKIKLLEEIIPDIRIVNRITKVSKWKIAKLLQSDPHAKKYIPETHFFTGADVIIKMLEKFSSVFLKPVRRSLGLGIIKIIKGSSNKYTAYFNSEGKNQKIDGDMDLILRKLEDVMGTRSYIVQQGISVALIDEKPFDLRVTMQKDGKGEWMFSRCSARIAAPGNIVTNVAAGGRGVSAVKVLRTIFNDKIEPVMNEVENAGLTIAKALDSRLDNIGDLGLDIGLDINGRVYLFEVNFRAIRPGNLTSKDAMAWYRTYYQPISYLRYLYDREIEKKYNPQL